LKKVLPHVIPLLKSAADLVVLVKPQFEAGRERVGRGGVIRDDGLRREIIAEVVDWCLRQNVEVRGGVDSAVAGPKGNVEHLLWLSKASAKSAT
jgi:23S rRNA (cytidine1920-2'-O)/16S rRNA (cytidine1409-2'-O)-methyltransferase